MGVEETIRLCKNKNEKVKETYEAVVGDLGTPTVDSEIPDVAVHSGKSDIGANDEVAEEEPAVDNSLVLVPGGLRHDVLVSGVKSKGGSRQAVRDKVDPKELHGDEGLRGTENHSQEDAAVENQKSANEQR